MEIINVIDIKLNCNIVFFTLFCCAVQNKLNRNSDPRYTIYMETQETIVMSVGGSLIVPDDIDTLFLEEFRNFIERQIAFEGQKFIIIAGGGKTARKYQDAASSVVELNPEDLDWMGIHATRLNGHLLRTIFRDTAYPEIITNPDEIKDVPKETPLIIAAGYRPGASTDFRAVEIALNRNAKKLINLSNIDYVYTSDPRKDNDAKKIEDITWEEFIKLIPSEWDPGLSSPFDPVAARSAMQHGLEVAVISGQKMDSLEAYINGNSFHGTKIHS